MGYQYCGGNENFEGGCVVTYCMGPLLQGRALVQWWQLWIIWNFSPFAKKRKKILHIWYPYKKKIDVYLYFYLVLLIAELHHVESPYVLHVLVDLIADTYFSSQFPQSLPKEHDDVNTHMDLIKDVHTGIQCKSNLEMKHDNFYLSI